MYVFWISYAIQYQPTSYYILFHLLVYVLSNFPWHNKSMQEQVIDPNSSTAKLVDLIESLNHKYSQLSTLKTICSMAHIPDPILEILPDALQTCLAEIANLNRAIESWIPEEDSIEGDRLVALKRETLMKTESWLVQWAKSADEQLNEKIQQMKRRQEEEEMTKQSSTLRHLKQEYIRKINSANSEIFLSSDNEQSSLNFQQASQASKNMPTSVPAPVQNNNQSDSVTN